MITVRTLKCGITVTMERLSQFESAAVGIWVRAGAVNEHKQNAGISHFIEHMMFKGTTTRSAGELADATDRIGAQVNAFTGKEATCYYIKSLSSNLEEALQILLDMFTDSVFDSKELNRERQVIKEELKMILDTPDEDAHDTICETVFRDEPIGHSIIGSVETLDGIRREQILDYLHQEYTSDSIVVSVAGQFDEDRICRILEERMGDRLLSKSKEPYQAHPSAPAFRVKVKDIEQSHLCLATRSVSLQDERYDAFCLLSGIMGGGMSSRLFQSVREQKGLAYSVYATNSSFSHCGYFNIYAGVAHQNVEQAIQAICHELHQLGQNDITEEELQKAKEQMKSSYIFGLESVNGRMFSTGKRMTLLREVKEPQEILSRIDQVTMEDLQAVEAVLCDLRQYSAVLITDRERPLEQYVQENL